MNIFDELKVGLVLMKAEAVAWDAANAKETKGPVFGFAEEVYRFCDRHHGGPSGAMHVLAERLLPVMQLYSPAIHRARCHPWK